MPPQEPGAEAPPHRIISAVRRLASPLVDFTGVILTATIAYCVLAATGMNTRPYGSIRHAIP